MIELRGFRFRYPDAEKPALENVDLRVESGEMLLVAGSSGCGKSSLLRSLNGLIPHFHGGTVGGSVTVGGRDPIDVGPRGMSDLVGFVHQDPEAHFVAPVVEDELAFALENHGVDPATMRRRVEEVLDQLAVAHLRDREIDTLSGGERQRVAIAAVLTLQPQILVLDEPTSQLDPQSAAEVLTALRTLNEDLGLTVVLAEHRLERVASAADRVLLLDGGRVVGLGPPGETLADSPLAPPLVSLCRTLGWDPPTLTMKATRRRREFRDLVVPPAPAEGHATAEGPSAGPAVEARGLWWSYADGTEALRGLDLRVPRGTLTALLGRNGAGKSTLLKALVGLVRPERGRVTLRPGGSGRGAEGSIDPFATPLDRVAQQVGFVPQNPSRLLFHDTVDAELAWSLRQRGAAAGPGLGPLLAALGIDGLGDRHPRELSTGERQRVAVATALAGDPAILLLDEPTRGLDVAVKDRLAAWLRSLVDGGVTVVLSTHDVELVARCADRVVLLGDGRVVADGPTGAMLHGSPVFGTRINRLFGDPGLHTLDDVRRRLSGPDRGDEGGGEGNGETPTG
ncbi:MAG: ATP-binding cassette domain-containing protein [Acidobacteriota bacterium]